MTGDHAAGASEAARVLVQPETTCTQGASCAKTGLSFVMTVRRSDLEAPGYSVAGAHNVENVLAAVAAARLAAPNPRPSPRSAFVRGRRASLDLSRKSAVCVITTIRKQQCRCHVEGLMLFPENPDCSRRKRQRQRLHLLQKPLRKRPFSRC